MKKVSAKLRRWCSIFCAVILLCSLLLTGCNKAPEEPEDTTPAGTEEGAETPDNSETAQGGEVSGDSEDTDDKQGTDDGADASLVSLRQTMVETPQLFAVAYFGKVQQGADIFAVMTESAPQLCEDLPFLTAISADNIVGDEGEVFCIVPADENATVAVNYREWNWEADEFYEAEVMYRSEIGAPILVICPDIIYKTETEIVITDSFGNTVTWCPKIDINYIVEPLCYDNGDSYFNDFTSYDELAAAGVNVKIDWAELVGSWNLVWTEVEGDRNEAAPGVCTIEITMDESGIMWFTYTDKAFSDGNVSNREMIVEEGVLYSDCGNDRWVAEICPADGDTVFYTLTMLNDGTLLLQHYWETDDYPMLAYGGYERIG